MKTSHGSLVKLSRSQSNSYSEKRDGRALALLKASESHPPKISSSTLRLPTVFYAKGDGTTTGSQASTTGGDQSKIQRIQLKNTGDSFIPTQPSSLILETLSSPVKMEKPLIFRYWMSVLPEIRRHQRL